MNYRKKYCEELGIKLPSSWEIHHIDLNRENNNINNLIALPKFLHLSLHFYMSYYPNSVFFENAIRGRVNVKSLKRMADMLGCVSKCVRLKENIEMKNFSEMPKEQYFIDFAEQLKKEMGK